MYPETGEAISVVREGYKNNLIQWMEHAVILIDSWRRT